MGTQLPPKGHSTPPLFGPCLLQPNGNPSQQLQSSCSSILARGGCSDKPGWLSVFPIVCLFSLRRLCEFLIRKYIGLFQGGSWRGSGLGEISPRGRGKVTGCPAVVCMMVLSVLGGSVVQWLARWTRDSTVASSIPGRRDLYRDE